MPTGIYKRTENHIKKGTDNLLKYRFTWKGKKRPPFSEEWKRKLGEVWRNKKHSEEIKKKIIEKSSFEGGVSSNGWYQIYKDDLDSIL